MGRRREPGGTDDGSAASTVTRVLDPLTSPSLGDALDRDEAGRISVFARLTMLLCVFGLVLTPLYGGDPLARRWLIAALIVAGATSTFVEWMTRRPGRYRSWRLLLAVQIQELCATTAAYFFGVFSPFPAVVSLGIYVYSLGASFGNALASYLNLAIGHAVLTGLIIGGVLEDRGLVHADYLDTAHQLMVLANVEFVYAVALVLGRLSRRKTVAAVEQLESAVRAVAQRDALFHEARQELERAAWLGGPGRFSEQRLGAYVLAEVIGRGAMGEIYRARHVDTGEPAAIKLLQRSVAGDPMYLARFIREAELAASLDTPHVVRVVDSGLDPLPFIAMELLVGDDLARLLRDRRVLSLDETAELLAHAAAGLAAAHAVGIIHRDVKPQNLFRTTEPGRLWKVLDFGISKAIDDGGTLTGGAIVGTPAYMAPEQALGRPLDHRADLYALAAVAYRCVTGHPAFAGPDAASILYAVAHRTPARPGTLATLPADLDAFFAIALAKRPSDRFAEGPRMAEAFARAARNELDAPLRSHAEALLATAPRPVPGRRPTIPVR